jgi:hypothetical protein
MFDLLAIAGIVILIAILVLAYFDLADVLVDLVTALAQLGDRRRRADDFAARDAAQCSEAAVEEADQRNPALTSRDEKRRKAFGLPPDLSCRCRRAAARIDYGQ